MHTYKLDTVRFNNNRTIITIRCNKICEWCLKIQFSPFLWRCEMVQCLHVEMYSHISKSWNPSKVFCDQSPLAKTAMHIHVHLCYSKTKLAPILALLHLLFPLLGNFPQKTGSHIFRSLIKYHHPECSPRPSLKYHHPQLSSPCFSFPPL